MTATPSKRVLVVGTGISGLATATRLHRAGWTPVLVERAPARRSGGYFVALFGTGQIAARRLGILDSMHDRAGTVQHLDIDRNGGHRDGMSFADVPGKPWMMLRGDAERAAFDALPSDVEIHYSTVPTEIVQDPDGVDVTLLDTAAGSTRTERFDLVVGADGLRSTVRSLVFGPHEDHLHRLNFMIGAFEYAGTPPGLAPGQGATLLEPGRSMWVFAFRDHDPTILLSYRTDDVDAEFTRPPAQSIRAAFGPRPLGRTLGDVVDAAGAADRLLFDSVEQVHLDTWHRGRVVLVGDSAWCVTLYAGMGVSAGFAGADLLGAVLERHADDVPRALAEWEALLRPYVDRYQRSAFQQRKIFVVDNRREVLLRRTMPKLARFEAGRRLAERMMPRDDAAARNNDDIVGETLGEPAPQEEKPVG
ncbi:FAD-dependent monooxygenase [Saccharopolyspora sp. NPDC047091]|uniref:FAD-dependent monooxygenase n=1 Tax=Saccharopolyspora sp. NPDC047091 TaxID=3155924 RepID=UPI0033DFA1E5